MSAMTAKRQEVVGKDQDGRDVYADKSVVVPGSLRPDGTRRKDLRVRAEQRPDGSWRSFVPQDEVKKYAVRARRPANPPGAAAGPPLPPPLFKREAPAGSRSARRAAARRRAREAAPLAPVAETAEAAEAAAPARRTPRRRARGDATSPADGAGGARRRGTRSRCASRPPPPLGARVEKELAADGRAAGVSSDVPFSRPLLESSSSSPRRRLDAGEPSYAVTERWH